jgi:hypothetical protein
MILKILAALAIALTPALACAHDRHYAINSEMHDWFMTLKSDKGPCCADSDGNVVADTDWESSDGHYRVKLDDKWVDVPDGAVIKQPNLYGRTMVWPIHVWGMQGTDTPVIRCFMPGAGG